MPRVTSIFFHRKIKVTIVGLSVRPSDRCRKQMDMKMKSDRTHTWYMSSTSIGAFNLTWSDQSDDV